MERFNERPYLLVKRNELNRELFRVVERFETIYEAEKAAAEMAAGYQDKVYHIMEVRSAWQAAEAQPSTPVNEYDYLSGDVITHFV